ncbi:putative BsuMI modification methylase subunit YdiP [compost metagenome]
MNHLSLFSGIGGIDLAAEWAGMKTIAFCEREPFPQKVLKKHWPDVPIYDDVCNLTKARLEEDGITGNGRTIDIISGGYPCQPFSVAGQRKGEDDDRHLWPEVFRLIQTVQPRWFVGENVAGHITLGIDVVLADLESIGYEWETFVLPAMSVGAPHRRDRVFIVAHSHRERWKEHYASTSSTKLGQRTRGDFEKILSNAYCQPGLQANKTTGSSRSVGGARNDAGGFSGGSIPGTYWDVSEPPVFGVAYGLPDHMDRVKALGNAVVPQQIYPIMAAIKTINDLLGR